MLLEELFFNECLFSLETVQLPEDGELNFGVSTLKSSDSAG